MPRGYQFYGQFNDEDAETMRKINKEWKQRTHRVQQKVGFIWLCEQIAKTKNPYPEKHTQ